MHFACAASLYQPFLISEISVLFFKLESSFLTSTGGIQIRILPHFDLHFVS